MYKANTSASDKLANSLLEYAMRFFVTGAAGFVGSNIVDHVLARGHDLVGYDNLSTGRRPFLASALKHANFRFVEGDLLDVDTLAAAMYGTDVVIHMAANADVRFGLEHPRKDLEQNTIATFNVLEAMRANNAKTIVFASTGSVYGTASLIPTPETAPFPIQTSLYGASKLACEGLIAAYTEGYSFVGYIFRFVSILGERYTHGHVFDFVKKLSVDPSTLHILGDGLQRKSYLYVGDCVNAIQTALDHAHDKLNVFNLGIDDYCDINDSVSWITARLGVSPRLTYAGGDRGWVGDNPFIYLDTQRIRSLGWRPHVGIRSGIERTVDWLKANKWVFDR
jgi:UDP-glucose 4-epimerase